MKKKYLLISVLLIIGLAALFEVLTPQTVEATPVPTRQRVFCEDGVNYYCKISIETPYCDGYDDPSWNRPTEEYCPTSRTKLLCPLGVVYYCSISTSGPNYCWEFGANWDDSFGDCPY